MMKSFGVAPWALVALALAGQASGQQGPPAGLVTRWAALVRPDSVLPEYPRPQMVRVGWENLNGSWDYAITDTAAGRPSRYDGRILVPFAVESQLSGVRRPVTPGQALWYHRSFTAPSLPVGGRLLLHFGAIDWQATVFVNGTVAGEHRGGYDPFTVDVTDALGVGPSQDLVVRVWDPTDSGPQPRGKQVLKPEGIFYTAVTGIWQTVWLEPVPALHITDVRTTPAEDLRSVRVLVSVAGGPSLTPVRLTVRVSGREVARVEGYTGREILIAIPGAHLWSPDDPFLYGLAASLPGGDSVTSYFGLRRIEVGRDDSAGVRRLFLNGRPLFEYGLLDQGWWPDGLYTAPTDEALQSDIEATRRLGFNLIRKHVKVEPARWYYHADRLGMLVWQDMPSGNNDTPEGKREFEDELRRMVDGLRSHPAIVMWVPFNEGWGQHDTERYARRVKAIDPSRLVDNASGWTDRHVGDVADLHSYPAPGLPPPDSTRALVLGEFGGLGLPLHGHLWKEQSSWGYRTFDSPGTSGRDTMR